MTVAFNILKRFSAIRNKIGVFATVVDTKDLESLSPNDLQALLIEVAEARGSLFGLCTDIMAIQNTRFNEEHFKQK